MVLGFVSINNASKTVIGEVESGLLGFLERVQE